MRVVSVLKHGLPFLICIAIVAFLPSCAQCVGSGPPKKATTSPESIISYFCERWADGDFLAMYETLSFSRRKHVSVEKWEEMLARDATIMGLPTEYSLDGPEQDLGSRALWKVDITFSNNRVGTLNKRSWVLQGVGGWRVDDGGLGPFNTGYSEE
jgi:hypothetical protein